jgi:hypothetical protein
MHAQKLLLAWTPQELPERKRGNALVQEARKCRTQRAIRLPLSLARGTKRMAGPQGWQRRTVESVKVLLAKTPLHRVKGHLRHCLELVPPLGLPSRICQASGYFDRPRSCDVILRTNRGLL